MAQEETQNYSNNTNSGGGGGSGFSVGSLGGGSCCSKKQKHKKQPQRGLGVAQLEKIRLEDQKKKEKTKILPSPPRKSPTRPPSDVSVPLGNYESYPVPSNSDDLCLPNSTVTRVQIVDPARGIPVILDNPVAWQPNPALQLHGNLPTIWSSNPFGLGKESCVIHPGPATFIPSFNFFYEPNPSCLFPGLVQRPQQYLQQQPSSPSLSMGNGSSSANSSSSLVNLPSEPPSNQSNNANHSPFCPEEEKNGRMVGMKRPYPFSVDHNPQGPPLPCRLPAIFRHLRRSDGPPSFPSECTFNFNPRNPIFSEGPSSSSNSVLDPDSKRSISQSGASNGDFLKLAPPATTVNCPISKFKGHFPYVAFNSYQTFDFDSFLTYQRSMGSASLLPATSEQDGEQPYYYSFLPPSVVQVDQTKKSVGTNGEVGENIDLNLKL